jgi:Caspase domain/Bacterial SH3 domain
MRAPSFLLRCILILIFLGAAVLPASAASRIALVIGNADYLYANALPNPVNDANLLAGVLRSEGFEVTAVLDADQRTMKRAFSDFAARLQMAGPDAVALVYYAGHGVQFRGVNYLIPVDARLDTEAQLDIETLSADTIMQAIAAAGSKLNIVILDACRNSPFRSFRAVTRGLAAIDAPQGTLVAFSTAPGQAARDGAAGANSPYSAALGEMLRQPGLRIEDVFKRVRQRVSHETNGEQTPWESSSLVGDFYPAGGGVSTLANPQSVPLSAFDPPLSPPRPPKTQYYYVWDTRPPDDWLALRSEPGGRAGRRLAQLPNGTMLEVLEQRPDNWWRVRAIGWGMEGWVLSREGSRVWVYCCRSQ